ncbi:MAG: integrase core domain-containing protein [Candidatus Vogelbacteria bacterium]|nr:integrase core domain-containing protein [Candidatus Vogelbacteria bacterium]
MCISMAKTIKEERVRWVLPIINKEVKLAEVAKVCPYSQRSLERWLAEYRKHGEAGLEPKSTEPKTQPKETAIKLKEEVVRLRKRTKLCALKLHWRLKKQGINLHPRTIGKILKKEGLVRKYRVKKIKYKYIKAERKPGELVEHLEAYDEETNNHSVLFLQTVMKKFKYEIRAIKTDNGSIFTNYYLGANKRSDRTVKSLHALDQFCADHNVIHYLIDPGKPAQNGTVERSHREDQEKFYEKNKFKNFADLQKKLKRWNMYYNNLEHCGLNGQTPNEFLRDYQLIKPPNVCA